MNQAPTYVEASYRLFDKELPMRKHPTPILVV